jgi:hypothetical protein
MTTGSTTLPIDPNVKIPAAVLAQSAEADKLHQAAYSQEADPNNPNPEAPPAPAADTQAPPQVTPQVSQPAPAEEPPQRSETIQNGSWEQRYWSLYARLQQAEAGLSVERENNAALRGMLATMQTAPQPQDTPQQQAQSLLSEQERADYGEELLSVVGKKAREELMPVVQPLLEEINQLKQQVRSQGTFVAKSARQSMYDFLGKELPEWRDINKKVEFKQWLGLQDPLSGAKRQDMLNAAFEANQSPRVLAFFQEFLRGHQNAPTAGQQQAATPAPKTSLDSLAAPGRAKTAAAPEAPAPAKPIYTAAQINQFYRDSAQGKYRGREEEKNRIEQDIFLAQSEGRIKP